MPRSTLTRIIASYNDSKLQLDRLKERLYAETMRGRTVEIEKLKDAIIKFEADLIKFSQQSIEYKYIGEE
jgi:hypothetical protein